MHSFSPIYSSLHDCTQFFSTNHIENFQIVLLLFFLLHIVWYGCVSRGILTLVCVFSSFCICLFLHVSFQYLCAFSLVLSDKIFACFRHGFILILRWHVYALYRSVIGTVLLDAYCLIQKKALYLVGVFCYTLTILPRDWFFFMGLFSFWLIEDFNLIT